MLSPSENGGKGARLFWNRIYKLRFHLNGNLSIWSEGHFLILHFPNVWKCFLSTSCSRNSFTSAMSNALTDGHICTFTHSDASGSSNGETQAVNLAHLLSLSLSNRSSERRSKRPPGTGVPAEGLRKFICHTETKQMCIQRPILLKGHGRSVCSGYCGCRRPDISPWPMSATDGIRNRCYQSELSSIWV